MDTQALIVAAHRGDREAYNALVLKTQDEVYTLAYRALCDPVAAEEVTQHVFMQTYRELDSSQGQPFRTWILVRAAAECRRRLQYGQQPEQGHWLQMHRLWPWAASTRPGRTPGREGRASGLEGAFRLLSPDQRLALALVDLAGLDYQQAAAALSIPVQEVSQLLARARQALARKL